MFDTFDALKRQHHGAEVMSFSPHSITGFRSAMFRALPIALSFSLSLTVACVEPEIEIEESTSALASSNALSENRLSYNRLSYNRLSYNRLSYNRLSYNRLSYNSLDNDIHETEEGLDLLRYIVRCALAEGDSLVVKLDDGKIELPGSMGLAEDWATGPLDEEGQLRVSGCLLAHVNAFGVRVPISVRFQPMLKSKNVEREAFDRYEGVFFGNLFSEELNQLYSCYSNAPPEKLDTERGDRLLRLCASEDCGPIKSLGACSSICNGTENENYKRCVVPGEANQDAYRRPIHVWLLNSEDVRSAWPNHMEMLKDHYGETAPGDETTKQSK